MIHDQMACYHPLSAFRNPGSGEVRFFDRGDGDPLSLPCGQCIGCRLERSRQWAVRIVHEAACWPSNVFVTLTYRDDVLPDSLDYSHVQAFLKRLRFKFSGSKIRFFCVGEYGSTTFRPHYHIILFNCFFSDRLLFKTGDFPLYTSKVLSDLWGLGHVVYGDVSFESAAYCARYCVDKLTGDYDSMSPELQVRYREKYEYISPSSGEIVNRSLEFAHMSLKPGIGSTWLDKFSSDVYPSDEVIMRGKSFKPPRYYDRRFLATSDFMDDVLYKRYLDSTKNSLDNSLQRLEVRETVAKARLSLIKRDL